MKIRYYVGDPIIPWWVQKLIDRGLIINVRENVAVTFILTFKTSFNDTNENYLYDGDFLELNEETGSVTIGYEDWDRALAKDFRKQNWEKFKESLQKTHADVEKKEQYESDYNSNYWA